LQKVQTRCAMCLPQLQARITDDQRHWSMDTAARRSTSYTAHRSVYFMQTKYRFHRIRHVARKQPRY